MLNTITLPPPGPLTDVELDRLTVLLEQRGPTAMNLESLDEFLAALVVGPEFVSVREYLPVLWGEGVPFANPAEATEILGLVVRHWNAIADVVCGDVTGDSMYQPVMFQNENGATPANDWAKGFMRGVDMRPGAWGEFFSNESEAGRIIPMLMLSNEHNPHEQLCPAPIASDQRETLIEYMIDALPKIYRYFKVTSASQFTQAGQTPTQAEIEHSQTGYCNCGSGKPNKACCGDTRTTVH